MKKKKILIILKKYPFIKNGTLVYIDSVISALKKQGFTVKFLNSFEFKKTFFVKPDIAVDYMFNTIKLGNIIFYRGALYRKIMLTLYCIFGFKLFLNGFKKTSDDFCYLNKFEINFIKKVMKKEKFDAVIGNYVETANLFDEPEFKESKIQSYLLTHDIMSKRSALFEKKGLSNKSYINWSEDKEIEAWNKPEVVISIQKEETEYIKNLCPNKEIITVPFSSTLKMTADKRITIPFKKRIMYIAYSSEVNKKSMDTIFDIADMLEDCSFNIYGNVCNMYKNYQKTENINFMGRIKDVKEAYENNDISLIPLIAGTGLKIKTVEALSYSMPIVGTKYAVEGLRDSIGKCCFEGNTNEELIQSILNLTNNQELYNNAVREAEIYFKNNFTPEVAVKELVECLKK